MGQDGDSLTKKCIVIFVDAPFCPGYLFHFNFCWTSGPFVSRFEFGPRTYSVLLFIYFIESLSHFVLNFISCLS